jgi:hypothetical protein
MCLRSADPGLEQQDTATCSWSRILTAVKGVKLAYTRDGSRNLPQE